MSFVEIPKDRLDPATLRRLLEEFVSREGTDYGEQTFDLDQKISHVERQIDKGEASIVYDPETETCNIVTKDQLR
tara:strand:- start:156772 stop:156996 length:225 start_codon:yes stop_codon:yes gene_type:complete